jgi:SAM-dependent methyltransferase
LAALPPNGTVLDVGCGGGAASLALVPHVGLIVGVDERAVALAELAAACAERGVACTEVLGAWPGVAGALSAADVVVCHHVAYNVADLAGFAEALTTHARRRVVLELGASHPLTPLAPLWRHFWNLDRPSGPSAADAVAVLREVGIEPEVAIHDRPRTGWATLAEEVTFLRKRLCLPSSRDAEVAEQLEKCSVPSNEAWTLAWAGQA